MTGSLSIYAIVRLGASTVSVFGNLGTVLTILAGALILHEPIFSYHVIGATLIIAGILGMNLMRKKVKIAEQSFSLSKLSRKFKNFNVIKFGTR